MRYFAPTAVALALMLAGCQSTPKPEQKDASNQVKPAEPVQTAELETEEQLIEELTPAEPAPAADVWDHMARQMHWPDVDNKRVQTFKNWYKRNPEHLARVSERSEPFMHYIVARFEERGLPMELALLPIIESAFATYAISHVGASGFWQFTKPTAKHFGLQMDWWYDGRHDVVASTEAAIDMLEYLYKRLDNNWLYAVAAYNSGEGRVMRAIKRNRDAGKSTDFWSLSLPKETERYVPQLIALADVIKNPDAYGIKLHPVANQTRIAAVDVGAQIDLAYAAEMADVSVQQLQELNPGYHHWATSPKGPHQILLPLDKVDGFEQALAQSSPSDWLKWQRYQIKSGDSLSVIAKRHKTSVSIIKSVNHLKDNRITAGDHLLIPVAAKDASQYPMSLTQRASQRHAAGSNKIQHVVQSGDSLWELGRTYKVPYKSIARWNKIAVNSPLKLGSKLTIYTDKPSAKSSGNGVIRTITYKVRKGDSLSRIAARFRVTVKDLKRWNQFDDKYLQPGQKLKVHVDITKVSV
ncbi:lytic transglycosylase [Paraferrimonas sedimenticola]|uniref:Lytic transglycosylase n=1 Tax=Paraferrimonas sedimenticola TaxID=375674 RepID=A0AA37RV28_9GAMM|nr:LysM peptidoglycan-binding domain-containing protein [Paraferrimonas sedimenticola]GLP96200.1 lytic transglycosylase [Paraferrimonas sedimenticola]